LSEEVQEVGDQGTCLVAVVPAVLYRAATSDASSAAAVLADQEVPMKHDPTTQRTLEDLKHTEQLPATVTTVMSELSQIYI